MHAMCMLMSASPSARWEAISQSILEKLYAVCAHVMHPAAHLLVFLTLPFHLCARIKPSRS